ncbi:LAQU0S04e05556g1_1 [Lachancea quebecensis]|uniref:LAQU0S04e05556g1_1 n=1 Tax=Lachancea quebecensis TaxID=1654605 RepID=A0A0P1KQM4_9SACH|nr:LAQU0S04e05556g1_1 [Lachancea quebecensis]
MELVSSRVGPPTEAHRPHRTVRVLEEWPEWDNMKMYRRDGSSSTASSSSAKATSAGSGCVSCQSTPPACPTCADDEYCAVSLLTCSQCPQTYCTKKKSSASGSSSAASATGSVGASSGSKKSSARVGGIVGGVVGGVAFIAVLLLLWLYFKYWSKNRSRNKDVVVAREEYAGEYADDKEKGEFHEAGAGAGAGGADAAGLRDSRALYQARNRSSAATQMTKASNILPIAYIPGVTAGSRSQHKLPPLPRHLLRNGDTRSHITLGSSILGGGDDDHESLVDLPLEDSAQNADPGQAADGVYSGGNAEHVASQDALTTAIRARPKLVQISEEDEEHGDSSSGEAEDTHSGKHFGVTTVILRSSGDTSRQDDTVEDVPHSDDEDDDDGSFILDVGMQGSLRNATQGEHASVTAARESTLGEDMHREGSGSPFEDKFEL